jgi:hypothetical protein
LVQIVQIVQYPIRKLIVWLYSDSLCGYTQIHVSHGCINNLDSRKAKVGIKVGESQASGGIQAREKRWEATRGGAYLRVGGGG